MKIEKTSETIKIIMSKDDAFCLCKDLLNQLQCEEKNINRLGYYSIFNGENIYFIVNHNLNKTPIHKQVKETKLMSLKEINFKLRNMNKPTKSQKNVLNKKSVQIENTLDLKNK